MKRQLYYLIPDIKHAQEVCKDLAGLNIQQDRIHALMNEKATIEGVNDVHSMNEKDRDLFLERVLWRLNLAVFFIALLILIAMLVWAPSYYVFIPLAVMAATFLAGSYFTLDMPHVHWKEFYSAVRHGEVLLMVDAPVAEVRHIDGFIHRQHPEAVNGGVCWKA